MESLLELQGSFGRQLELWLNEEQQKKKEIF